MNLIALDLELEQPKTNSQTPDSKLDLSKIIQVGWVIFEPMLNGSMNILKERREYINIHVPLSEFIKKLTHITDEQIESGDTLINVYNKLYVDRSEFNTSRVIRQWGGGDMDQIRIELESETSINILESNNFKWEFGRDGFNVKHLYQAYALANNHNTSGGLSKCLSNCGLTWMGQGKHDALNDAVNTAQLYSFLQSKLSENHNE